ncbi:MAG: ammonium transporter [Chloroflexi bacterium]|nr:ammonium transporter [Chloroflexota bacterium]
MDTGDTAWMLVATALVMFMTPGLAFFYGGLVRNKNVLSTMMHSFIVIGLVSVLWVIVGYSLAFGSDWFGGLVGNPSDFFGMKDVGQEPGPYADTIPHVLFMVFQMTFAIITPALITGAFAERAKFGPFLVFMALWSLLVYAPIAHWVWGDSGWLQDLWGGGALDFAGGTVVHINAGAAALVAAVLYGRRVGYGREPMEPHNIPFVLLGAAILWFGWFGFNAGSALAADGIAANAFTVTFIATAAAMFTWAMLSWMFAGKPSAVGVAAGAVAGLVAITPAAGFVDVMPALAIGVGAGLFCYGAVQLRIRLRLDDSLDVVGVHGVGGAWGAFATGIFAVAAVGGGAGLIDDNAGQLARQLTGIGATFGYSFLVTLVILKVLDLTVGLRVEEEAERIGVDQSEHGERGYVFDV